MSDCKIIKMDEIDLSLKSIKQENFNEAKNNFVKSFVEMNVSRLIRVKTSEVCDEFQERFVQKVKAKIEQLPEEITNEYIEAISAEMMGDEDVTKAALLLGNFIVADKIEDVKIKKHANSRKILSDSILDDAVIDI